MFAKCVLPIEGVNTQILYEVVEIKDTTYVLKTKRRTPQIYPKEAFQILTEEELKQYQIKQVVPTIVLFTLLGFGIYLYKDYPKALSMVEFVRYAVCCLAGALVYLVYLV